MSGDKQLIGTNLEIRASGGFARAGANIMQESEDSRQRGKSRHQAEGIYGANLFAINSNDKNTEITIDLIEEDINEADHLADSKNSQRYSDEIKAKAYELSRDGISDREIGRQINVHHSTVSRWIKKFEKVQEPF